MRKALADTLSTLSEKDDRIIFLTGDLGFGVFDEFKNKFPEKYINVGVAESQMVSMSAGLAMEGYKPIVYSIASFLLRRAYEQIKISVCYHNLPVIFIGAGGGFIYSSSGPTHHSQEDYLLMQSIPNMQIFSPGTPNELKEIFPQIIESKAPSYIRIGKFGEKNINSEEKTQIYKIKTIVSGSKTAFVSNGDTLHVCLNTISKLNLMNIYPSLYHFPTIKPIKEDEYKKFINYKNIIVVEDSFELGGISSNLLNYFFKIKNNLNIVRKGPKDEFIYGNPTKEELRKVYGYDELSLEKFFLNNYA